MPGTQTATAHKEEGWCESRPCFCSITAAHSRKPSTALGRCVCFNRNAKWCGKQEREPSSWLQLIISSPGGWEDDSGVVKARPHWLWRGDEGRWVVWAGCDVAGQPQSTLVRHVGEKRWGAGGIALRIASSQQLDTAILVLTSGEFGGRVDNCSCL